MATENHIGGLWKIEQKLNFGFLIPNLLTLCEMTHTQQTNPWPLVPFAKARGITTERYLPHSSVSDVGQTVSR